ncbi:MAG: DUF1294 domain-containing protein [Clostridia bacterium]|nr:DUF1294 domain-containing protein [Clostridia bacterium]
MIPYYLLYLALMSLVTFCLYAADKRKAKKGTWRTPERVLLLFSFLGGAAGGTLAMYTIRHKTKHWYFVVVNVGSLILHAALAVLLLYLGL